MTDCKQNIKSLSKESTSISAVRGNIKQSLYNLGMAVVMLGKEVGVWLFSEDLTGHGQKKPLSHVQSTKWFEKKNSIALLFYFLIGVQQHMESGLRDIPGVEANPISSSGKSLLWEKG